MSKQAKSRRCVICRQDFIKDDLLRFVVNPDGELLFDVYAKAPARGTYICSDENCISRALDKKALVKITKAKMPDNMLEPMIKSLEIKIKKVFPLLKKANMITFGADFVADLVKAGKASYILIAQDCSKNSQNKIEKLAQKVNCDYDIALDKGVLEDSSGVANCAIVGFKACKLTKSTQNAVKTLKSLKKIQKTL